MNDKIEIEYNGETHSIYMWSKITKIDYKTLCRRYENGDRGEELFRKIRPINCKICGKEFMPQSHLTKICSDECKIENNKLNSRKRHIEMQNIKNDNKKNKKLTVTEIAVMAKEAGMSYGQYSAMLALRKEREANGKV